MSIKKSSAGIAGEMSNDEVLFHLQNATALRSAEVTRLSNMAGGALKSLFSDIRFRTGR